MLPRPAAALSQSKSAGEPRGLFSTSYPECMDALWQIKDYELASYLAAYLLVCILGDQVYRRYIHTSRTQAPR